MPDPARTPRVLTGGREGRHTRGVDPRRLLVWIVALLLTAGFWVAVILIAARVLI